MDLAVGVHPGISASDEALAPLPNNSVRLEFRTASEQNNVTDSEHVTGNRLHVDNFPVLNCGQHALTLGLKAESVATRDQLAGEKMEDRRL